MAYGSCTSLRCRLIIGYLFVEIYGRKVYSEGKEAGKDEQETPR